MGLFSKIFGGGESKEERRKKIAARKQSLAGSILGSSPYMDEWRRGNKALSHDYKYKHIDLMKQRAREDIDFERMIEKERQRYYRKYRDPKDAERFFEKWETRKRRELEISRERELKNMRLQQNEDRRTMSRELKSDVTELRKRAQEEQKRKNLERDVDRLNDRSFPR